MRLFSDRLNPCLFILHCALNGATVKESLTHPSAAPDRASVSCATDELNGSTQEATWRASQSLSHTNGHIRKNRHIAPIQTAKVAMS